MDAGINLAKENALMPQPVVRIDTVQFLKSSLVGMRNEVDSAYDARGNMEGEDEAHSALMAIKGRISVLLNFLDAVQK